MGQKPSVYPHNIKPKIPQKLKSNFNSEPKEKIVIGILVKTASEKLIDDIVVGIKVSENNESSNVNKSVCR